MSVTKKALWVNHTHDLNLDQVAQACGVSKFHLAHAFGQSTGKSVMQYARGRRLTEAARALAAGAPDILALALETGYASHEAFSRAFKASFGQTPDAVRAKGSVQGLALVEPVQFSDRSGAPIKSPQIISMSEILAIGLLGHYDFNSTVGIPGQWQQFMSEWAHAIPDKLPRIPIGITINFDVKDALTMPRQSRSRHFPLCPRSLSKFKFQHAATQFLRMKAISQRSRKRLWPFGMNGSRPMAKHSPTPRLLRGTKRRSTRELATEVSIFGYLSTASLTGVTRSPSGQNRRSGCVRAASASPQFADAFYSPAKPVSAARLNYEAKRA